MFDAHWISSVQRLRPGRLIQGLACLSAPQLRLTGPSLAFCLTWFANDKSHERVRERKAARLFSSPQQCPMPNAQYPAPNFTLIIPISCRASSSHFGCLLSSTPTMSLVRWKSSSKRIAARSGDALEPLEDAIKTFQSKLTPDQHAQLLTVKAIPDADAVMTFTAQLDATNRSRKGHSVASKVHAVLQSVRDFSAVDTFIQSNPELAALIWGSIKVTMMVSDRPISAHVYGVRFSSNTDRFEFHLVLHLIRWSLQSIQCPVSTV